MKNYVTYMLLAAATIGASSCESFLEEYNPTGSTEEAVYTTPEGFETGVNGCYSYTRGLWGKEEGHFLLEAGTDLWTGGSGNLKPELTNYVNLSASENFITDRLWSNSYAAINLCNTMLGYLDYANPLLKAQREAELRFLRAFHWWTLVECFGDIHFSTAPNRGVITTANKTAPDQVYAQVEQDLEFAFNNALATSTDLGRVTKPVVEAFWARLLLTRGKNAEAITHAKNVIGSYGYELEELANLWDVTKESTNKESIWAVVNWPTSNLNGVGTFLHQGYIMLYQNISGVNINVADGNPTAKLMPTYFLLSLFDQASDARFEASFQSVWKANNAGSCPTWTAEDAAANGTAVVGDPRYGVGEVAALLACRSLSAAEKFPKVAYNTYDANDLYNVATDSSPKNRQIYFSLKKHMDPSRTTANETATQKDFVTIRLSEMYLIIVEADFKLNGSTGADAIAYLNQLRAKRALPGAAASFTSVASIPSIDFVLDERARELCGEQLRWLDLKRTGKLVERVKKYNPDARSGIQPHHVLRPIPQDQISRVDNPGEFKQNTGY
ncbi:MAG: RagB/SusD family nutrient uptake outer membrane protein [Prevotellaceae bacterium]|jgi:hypothetical protein|nr:RagB/SusD family nutrient uptake outer membrane protein [Prevotellaceae bacterium]